MGGAGSGKGSSSRKAATIGLTGTTSGQTKLSFGPASGSRAKAGVTKKAASSKAASSKAAPAAAAAAAAAEMVDIDSDSEPEVMPKPRGRGRPKAEPAAKAAKAEPRKAKAPAAKAAKAAKAEPSKAKAAPKARAPKRSAAAAGVDVIDDDDDDDGDVAPRAAKPAAPAAAKPATPAAAAPPPAKKARAGPPWASGAPPRAGEKEVPVGAPNCLKGLVFCLTGVLESLHRDVASDLCKQYGARVVSALSRNVTHALIGEEAGASKLKKLNELKAAGKAPKVIDEDGLFELLRTREGDGPRPGAAAPAAAPAAAAKNPDAPVVAAKAAPPPVPRPVGAADNTELWVDKYRPKEISDLVANPKIAKDLEAWLLGWKSARAAERLARAARGGGGPKRGAPKSPESEAKAALLAGPPGIGKTSMAHVIARACGYEPHEMNASDTRNKAAIAGTVADIVLSSSISSFFPFKPKADAAAPPPRTKGGGRKGKGRAAAPPAAPVNAYPNGQVLIMDEVDGMSGGDRGGMQELIKVIASTQVPIICICNDDQAQKMRTLANHCFKLKFRRPMVSQTRARLLQIAMREGYRHIDPQTADKLAESCHGDIRAMINLLQTWRSSSETLSFTDVKERMKTEGKTRAEQSPFELYRSFFDNRSGRSINDRLDDFFMDADLMPLFVQENYPSSTAAIGRPHLLAAAADSISEGDLLNQIIRSEQRWDLMPAAGLLSAVRPGAMVAGGMSGRANFPAWLGKFSTERKNVRLVKELEMRCKAGTHCSQSSRAFRLDYVPALTSAVATPMVSLGAAGIGPAVAVLDAYFLNRDDVEALSGLGIYAKGTAPLDAVDSKVKATLTRTYNTSSHAQSTVSGAHFGVKGTAAAKPTPVSATAAEVVDVEDDADAAAGGSDADPDSDEEDVEAAKKFMKKGGRGKAGASKAAAAKTKRR